MITIGDAGLILLGFALLLVLIYVAVLIKNLIPAAKSLTKILNDAEVISGIAAETAQDAQVMVGDAKKAVSTVADIVKGNQSIISALTSIINATASLRNLVKRAEKKID